MSTYATAYFCSAILHVKQSKLVEEWARYRLRLHWQLILVIMWLCDVTPLKMPNSFKLSRTSILLIALGFGAFPMVLRHCLRSLPKPPLREAFDMSRSHQFPIVPAYFSARCRSHSSASAKPVVVVGPHLFTRSSRNRSQSINLFTSILRHQWHFLIVAVESGVFDCFLSTTTLNEGWSLL